MLENHLTLRRAARGGDLGAALELAACYFQGRGVPRNYDVGMAYLLDPLQQGVKEAQHLAVDLVPVDVLVRYGHLRLLEEASLAGVSVAQKKLGLWYCLAEETRTKAAELFGSLLAQVEDPGCLSNHIKLAGQSAISNANTFLIEAAERALVQGRLRDAMYCIASAQCIARSDKRTNRLLVRALMLSAKVGSDLPYLLPRNIHRALKEESETMNAEALILLGCGWAGFNFHALPPATLAARTNHRKALAALLRAADAGRADAWMKIYTLTSDYKSSAANRDLAKFCLEKAAYCRVPTAQRLLAVTQLASARTVLQAEPFVAMLYDAAHNGDSVASDVLQSFLLPPLSIPFSYSELIIRRAEQIDLELGMRLRLAFAFRLTLEEILRPLKSALRVWGLVLPASRTNMGRVVPVVDEGMKSEIERGAVCLEQVTVPHDLLAKRWKPVILRLVREAGLTPDEIFPKFDAAELRRYAFGSAWATRIRRELGLNSKGAPRI